MVSSLLEGCPVHAVSLAMFVKLTLTVASSVSHPSDPPSSNITMHKVNMPILYGTHHTKMMFFEYTEGMRVVIHTANLVDSDWEDRTQGELSDRTDGLRVDWVGR